MQNWKSKYSIKLKFFGFSLLFLIAIILLVLPANYFDNGQSVCISMLLLNKQCYACGMTRAVQHLIHLDFKTACEYNWLVYIVFPLLAYLLIDEFIKLIREVRDRKRQ